MGIQKTNVLLNNGKTIQAGGNGQQYQELDNGTKIQVVSFGPETKGKVTSIFLPNGEKIMNYFDENGNITSTQKYNKENECISNQKFEIQS